MEGNSPHNEGSTLLGRRKTSAQSDSDNFTNLKKLLKKVPIRFFVGLLTLLGLVNVLMMRCCLSVAIVDMVAVKSKVVNKSTVVHYRDFNWSKKEQGIALSSFFWGYISFQIPGAILSFKYGGKRVFGIGILLQAIFGMLLPFIKYFGGFYLLLTIRVFQGIFEGTTFPSMMDVLCKWTPKTDRSRMFSFVLSGNYIGTVCGMIITGYITRFISWQVAFICVSSSGILWFLTWNYFVTDLPENHPLISFDEAEFIKLTRETDTMTRRQWRNIPIKKILFSKSVWAVSIAMFTESWGQFTIMTEFPTYLSTVYHVEISKSGLYSGLPYLLMVVFLYISGYISDFLQSKNVMSVSRLRKLFVTFGFGSQILFIMFFTFTTTLEYSVAFVCLALAFGSASISGYGPVTIDLNPKYSAVVIALTNSFCNLSGVFAPLVCGYLTSQKSKQWHTVFYIVMVINFIGALIFNVFASSRPEMWD